MPRGNDIRIRSGTTTPSAANFNVGEPAWDKSAGKLYVKNAAGSMVEVGGGGGGVVFAATVGAFPATGSATLLYCSTEYGRLYRWDTDNSVYVEVAAWVPSDPRWSLLLPPAPTGVTAAPHSEQAVVTWTAPAVSSQTPITDYVVQYSSNGGSTWTTFDEAASSATAATVTGLTNGTAYQFRVAAVNGVGTGAYSTASAAVTPNVAVDQHYAQVHALLHMEGNGSAFVDSSPNARAITVSGAVTQTSSQLQFGSKSAQFQGGRLTFPAPAFGSQDWVIEMWVYPTSLNGALFSARSSVAVNGGLFLYAETSSLSIYAALSDNSGWQSGSIGFSLTLNEWQHFALVRSGNAMRAYRNGVGGNVISISHSIGQNGDFALMAGSATGGQEVQGFVDEFRITVGSDRGYTGATIPVQSEQFLDLGPASNAPSAPTGLAATAGNAQLALTWTAPANGGAAITGYTVEYTPSGGSPATVNTGSSANSYTLTGLNNGTSYSVRVRAVNAVGDGIYSAAVTGTPAAVTAPGPVASFSAPSRSCQGVSVVWQAPVSDGGSAITGYRVIGSSAGWGGHNVLYSAPSRSANIIWYGAESEQPVTLEIFAINAVGSSPVVVLNTNFGYCN